MYIPKGKSKEDVVSRRKIIISQLSKLRGKDIYCPCLKAKVFIVKKSNTETATWASVSYDSTIAALDLKNQLKVASFDKFLPPKPAQKNKFGFDTMAKLIGRYGKSETKIMVGIKRGKVYIHYCITSLRK